MHLNLTFKLMCSYYYKHLTPLGPLKPYGTGKGENCSGLWGEVTSFVCSWKERCLAFMSHLGVYLLRASLRQGGEECP